MWFGNHVTMEWWDDIWLNEGFARFSEHHILDTLRPTFRSWDKYLYQVYMVAMEKDWVFDKTHPVQIVVPDPESLMDIFDTISYAKGSVICRMLHNYLGKDAFTASLKKYLTIHASGSARTADLLGYMD